MADIIIDFIFDNLSQVINFTLKTLHIPAVIFTSQLGLEKWKLNISDKIVI